MAAAAGAAALSDAEMMKLADLLRDVAFAGNFWLDFSSIPPAYVAGIVSGLLTLGVLR